MTTKFFSFPPDVLSDFGEKLTILRDSDDFLALNKPENIDAKKIISAFISRVKSSSKQLTDLSIVHPQAIFPLDCEISGVFLLSKNKTSAEILRNLYGSQLFEFIFHFISFPSKVNKTRVFTCSLPIAKHFLEDRMIISKKTGKKSQTTFEFVENVGKYELWSAKSSFVRRHQVRLHAHECGIKIIGENVYSEKVFLDFYKKFAKPKSITTHWTEKYFPLHLSEVQLKPMECGIKSPFSKKFNAIIKLLSK